MSVRSFVLSSDEKHDSPKKKLRHPGDRVFVLDHKHVSPFKKLEDGSWNPVLKGLQIGRGGYAVILSSEKGGGDLDGRQAVKGIMLFSGFHLLCIAFQGFRGAAGLTSLFGVRQYFLIDVRPPLTELLIDPAV